MNLGDLLDGGVRLFLANWRALLLAVGIVIVPFELASAWLLRDLPSLFEQLADPATLAVTTETTPLPPFGSTALLSVVLFLLYPVLAGAVCTIVAGSYTGQAIDWRAALGAAGRHFWPLVLSSFLVLLAIVVPFVPSLVLLGVATATESLSLAALSFLLLLATLLGILVIVALLSAAPPAIVVEHLGAWSALARSWRLRRPRLWATVGAVLVGWILAGIVGGILGMIPRLIGGFVAGDYAWVFAGIGQTVSSFVQFSFSTIIATLLYFDGRIRREGFDLQVMAAELGRSRGG